MVADYLQCLSSCVDNAYILKNEPTRRRLHRLINKKKSEAAAHTVHAARNLEYYDTLLYDKVECSYVTVSDELMSDAFLHQFLGVKLVLITSTVCTSWQTFRRTQASYAIANIETRYSVSHKQQRYTTLKLLPLFWISNQKTPTTRP